MGLCCRNWEERRDYEDSVAQRGAWILGLRSRWQLDYFGPAPPRPNVPRIEHSPACPQNPSTKLNTQSPTQSIVQNPINPVNPVKNHTPTLPRSHAPTPPQIRTPTHPSR